MFKKLFLNLGSAIIATTPIVAVVSCGDVETKTPTKENMTINNFLKSNAFVGSLETMWQEKLIKDQLITTADFTSTKSTSGLTNGLDVIDIATKNQEIRDALKYYLTYQTNKDSAFIRKIGQRILSINTNVTSADLMGLGLLKEYHFGSIAFGTSTGQITNEALNLIFNTKVLNIKQAIYKHIITKGYLSEKKENWSKAFKDESDALSITNQLIGNTDFVLIKELLEKRYFASWEINMEDTAGLYYNKEKSADDLLTMMNATSGSVGELASLLSRSDKKARADEKIVPVIDGTNATYASKIYNMGAYKGIATMKRTKNDFAFTRDALMQKTNMDMWNGFVQEDKIIRGTDMVKIQDQNKANTINVKYVSGLMPKYDGTNLVLDGFMSSKKAEMIQFVAAMNEGLYNKAMDFYRTKRGTTEAVYWNITQPEVKTRLNQLGVKFISERKVD